jgi:hypothetical protein
MYFKPSIYNKLVEVLYMNREDGKVYSAYITKKVDFDPNVKYFGVIIESISGEDFLVAVEKEGDHNTVKYNFGDGRVMTGPRALFPNHR